MLCENQVAFLSCKRSQFVNKNGEAIPSQRVYFLPFGGDELMDLTALNCFGSVMLSLRDSAVCFGS